MAATEQNIVLNKDVQLPPFRPLNEFIFDKTRYDWPNVGNFEKLNNRMYANLLYFQTNYFVVILGYVILATLLNAKAMAIGMVILLLICALAGSILSNDQRIIEVRHEHPYAVLGVIIVVCYGFISFLPQVITTLFAWCVPIAIVLVHSAVRLRNLNNKINQNVLEGVVRDTVMGKLFSLFQVKQASPPEASSGIRNEKDIVNALKKQNPF
uniref:PRA1 family protein n=1 Tax=Panagrolaimus superbus TaxID=310955 RepID=A0A914YE84_9BILA